MRVGGRNRVMHWTGTAIPYKPGKNDLLEVDPARRRGDPRRRRSWPSRAKAASIPVNATCCRSARGRPTSRFGTACRSCPIAINGTSWLAFGGRVRVRVGEPLAATGRPTREAVEAPHRPGHREPSGVGRRRPGRSGAGTVRTLADRAVQRLAGGVESGGRRRRDGPAGARPGRSAPDIGRGVARVVVTTPAPASIPAVGSPALAYFAASNEDAGGTVGATGLSSDPKEYRGSPGRPGRRARSTPGSPSCCATS